MKNPHYIIIIIMSTVLCVCYYMVAHFTESKSEPDTPKVKKIAGQIEAQPIVAGQVDELPVRNQPVKKAPPVAVPKAIAPDVQKPDYYQAVNQLSGEELKAALNKLIGNHRVLTYSELWEALRDLDAGDEGKVVLIYQRTQRDAFSNGGDLEDWNREHLWPRAYGIGRSSIANTDLHHIRASDVAINGLRGHLYFDETDGEDFGGEKYSADADSWEPPNEVKGDIARALFYMAVRYEKGEQNSADLELSESPDIKKRQHGKLSVLLKWHDADPVSEQERKRNDKVYRHYQGNRNPFIDHPEYAERIFRKQ